MSSPANRSELTIPLLDGGQRPRPTLAAHDTDTMRVLMLASGLPVAGAERNIVAVLPYLRAHADVRLCTLNRRRDSEPLAAKVTQNGGYRADLGARRLADPQAWYRLVRLAKRLKPDIIHSQDQDTHIYAAIARSVLGIPTIMTRHVQDEPVENIRTAVRARMVLLTGRYACDQVIAVSEATRRWFGYRARVPLEKIETVYNGLDLSPFPTPAERASLRAQLGWNQTDKIVAMVAALRPGKGHEVLSQAIPSVAKNIPGLKVKLIGDGPLMGEVRAEAERHGDTVEVMGERHDVPLLLAASDLLVLPSWSEALPTVLIEAGAASLPTVASDVGGAGEIVINGDTGWLVPAGDADQLAARMIAVLSDPEAASQMGERARSRVEHLFSLKRQAQQTALVYRDVISRKKAKRR